MLAGTLIHLIDDDSRFLKGIERLLNAHELQVRSFTSAEQFQAEVDPAEVSCLVLDIHLGGISGIELLERLHAAQIRMPVIVLTANESDATRKAAAAAGCMTYLVKPVSARLLLDSIRETLAN